MTPLIYWLWKISHRGWCWVWLQGLINWNANICFLASTFIFILLSFFVGQKCWNVFSQSFLFTLSLEAIFKATSIWRGDEVLCLDNSPSSSSRWFILKWSTSWGVNFFNTGIHQNFIKLSQPNLSLRTLIKHQWMIYSTYGADLPLISLLQRYKSYKSPAYSRQSSPLPQFPFSLTRVSSRAAERWEAPALRWTRRN